MLPDLKSRSWLYRPEQSWWELKIKHIFVMHCTVSVCIHSIIISVDSASVAGSMIHSNVSIHITLGHLQLQLQTISDNHSCGCNGLVV